MPGRREDFAFGQHFSNVFLISSKFSLNNNPEADLSEDEGGPNELQFAEDGRSRISASDRSGLSEIADGQSAMIGTGKQGQLCFLQGTHFGIICE